MVVPDLGELLLEGVVGAVVRVAADAGLLAEVADGQLAVGHGGLAGQETGERVVEPGLGEGADHAGRL